MFTFTFSASIFKILPDSTNKILAVEIRNAELKEVSFAVIDLEKQILLLEETGFEELISKKKEIKLFLEGELVKLGVQQMKTLVGDSFDPNYHTAIAMLPIPNMVDNQIIDISQVGYTIGNRLLRDAKVVVVKNT